MGKSKKKKKYKSTGTEGLLLLFLALAGLFVFFLFDCISNYSEFNIDYSDVMCDELTFNRYERVRKNKDIVYEIYFEETEKTFMVNSIADSKLDVPSLEELEKGEILKIYYYKSEYRGYDYGICEMSSSSTMLLSLSDYINANQSNQIIGIIVCSVLIFFCLVLLVIFIFMFKSPKQKNKSKLGRIKIEYSINGNVIRVYNSIHVCSLVINDKIADQYFGVVADKFSLKGKLYFEEKEIPVEVKVGHVNMRLYYDGELVAKKFIGLG